MATTTRAKRATSKDTAEHEPKTSREARRGAKVKTAKVKTASGRVAKSTSARRIARTVAAKISKATKSPPTSPVLIVATPAPPIIIATDLILPSQKKYDTGLKTRIVLDTRRREPKVVRIGRERESLVKCSETPYGLSNDRIIKEIYSLPDDTWTAGKTGLTFGVEMELLLTVNTAEFMHHLPTKIQAQGLMACALAFARCDAADDYQEIILCKVIEKLQRYGLDVNNFDADKHDLEEDVARLDAWTVAREMEIGTNVENAEDAGVTTTIGFELKTPKLPFSAESLRTVAATIEHLNSQFNISYNTTCAVHVHVGLTGGSKSKVAKQVEFPVCALQNITTAYLLFEDRLERLFPPHWISNPVCDFFVTKSKADSVRHVQEADSMKAFWKVLGQTRKLRNHSLNFLNLKSRYRTVEFRRHSGCFDAEGVLRWVMTVCAMTRWAVLGGRKEGANLQWLAANRFDEGVDVVDVLRYVGLNKGSVKYYSKRLDPTS